MRAMIITADSLLSRLKCGCDGSYDVAMKGLSVVVRGGGNYGGIGNAEAISQSLLGASRRDS